MCHKVQLTEIEWKNAMATKTLEMWWNILLDISLKRFSELPTQFSLEKENHRTEISRNQLFQKKKCFFKKIFRNVITILLDSKNICVSSLKYKIYIVYVDVDPYLPIKILKTFTISAHLLLSLQFCMWALLHILYTKCCSLVPILS